MSALKATIDMPTPTPSKHAQLAGSIATLNDIPSTDVVGDAVGSTTLAKPEIPGRRCPIPGYRNFTVYVPRHIGGRVTAMQRSSICLDETVIATAIAGVGIERLRQIVKDASRAYGPKCVGDGRITRSRHVMHELMQACAQQLRD